MSGPMKINNYIRFSQDIDSSYAVFITIYADLVFRENLLLEKGLTDHD